MNSQEFAQEHPWISYRHAMRIAEEHGVEDEACDEILLGDEIETRNNANQIRTASLLLWLGY